MRIFRVTVRGWFDGLTAPQRADLVARAPEHDVVFVGGYTEAGTLAYEPSLHTFTFRVQLRSNAEGDDAELDVRQRATAMALARLAELGAGHRDLKVTTVDMATMWQDP